jgi:hypothetical protein
MSEKESFVRAISNKKKDTNRIEKHFRLEVDKKAHILH